MKKRKTPLMSIPKELTYVEGALFDDYIHDMKIIQQFAVLNRKAMVDVILPEWAWLRSKNSQRCTTASIPTR